ncbi:MAG TPA: HAD family hydrolase [Gemmatimonadaceae bacterium]|jgi:3-deoxy-D-manno-octulosonate 8-phosphate phosphatase (KDO 8-P phosphatase)|nr:HAD family hydrolase [Gemmatimonadaceae bacterium]
MIDPTVARRIRLVALDVDGVLTDGGIYLGAVDGQPFEFKRFDIQDGLGIHFLRRAGIRVAIITGRVSESVRLRAAELHIEDVAQVEGAQKLPALAAMLARYAIAPSEVAFVGDDFPDLVVMRRVAIGAAVANAVTEVRQEATVPLTRTGGHGAVREFAELLLRARGEWEALWHQYVAERDGIPETVA